MEGCSDGTFQQTGQKFFDCPIGRGLYYPLRNLKPDARYAPEHAEDGNHKKDGSGLFVTLHQLSLVERSEGNGDQCVRPKEPAAASTGLYDDPMYDPNLTVGSLVQIPTGVPTYPWRYGTIKWIGLIPNVQGKIAGIELVCFNVT